MKTAVAGFLWLVLSVPSLAQSAVDMRSGDVDVGDSVHIHYVEAGDRRSKLTMLFIPGWSMTTLVWEAQMARFSGGAHVVAIDPRSQGASTITLKSNTPEQRAQDLHRVIQHLGLQNIVLIGWSQGVQDVAAYAAAFSGDAIAGYVLVDAAIASGAAGWTDRPKALQEQLESLALYERHPNEYLHGMLNAIIQSADGRKRIEEYARLGLRTPPDIGITMLLMDFIAYDRRPAIASFNRPTLIIAAAKSPELDEQQRISRQIPGSRFETIPAAGHALFLDQPERFHALLADFVGQINLKKNP